MKRQGAIALLLLPVMWLLDCNERVDEQRAELRGGEIVRVGDVTLTETYLDNLLPEGERIPFSPEEKRAIVQRWVDTEVLCQEAMRRGLQHDPRIETRLRSLEQEFLADHLVFLELRSRTRVTEEEIEAYFTAHEREYLYEYRVSHILLSTLEEAQEVQELLEKRSFRWVANRYSIDPVAKRGGDLGYLTKGNMIPEFETVVFGMEPNEVSDIVKSDFGYHIVKLIGTREALVKVELADVRERIMNQLMIEKREQAYRDLLDSLKANTDVEYYGRPFVYDAAPAAQGPAGPDTGGVETGPPDTVEMDTGVPDTASIDTVAP